MEQVIERDDIVEFEKEEWKVYWICPNGQVELVENATYYTNRNTVAWMTDLTLIRKGKREGV